MKKLLENILESEITIISYPRCDLPVTKIYEKVTTIDFLVQTKGKLIHLEIKTGTGFQTRAKNFTGFTKVYNRNNIRGNVYDTETLFLHIDFQYGLKENRPLFDQYTIRNEENQKYIENFRLLVINMDKVVRFWYDEEKEKIEKYKYIIMLDLKKGKESGKKEREVEIAKELFNMGLPIEQIIKATNLPKEALEDIIEK